MYCQRLECPTSKLTHPEFSEYPPAPAVYHRFSVVNMEMFQWTYNWNVSKVTDMDQSLEQGELR